jgi:hypothetical protein
MGSLDPAAEACHVAQRFLGFRSMCKPYHLDLDRRVFVCLHDSGRIPQRSCGDTGIDVLVDRGFVHGEMRVRAMGPERIEGALRGASLGRVMDDFERATRIISG